MDITLKLKVKNVEIELTMEDAKELRDALNDLVGEQKVIHEHHDHYPWHYVPYSPWPGYPRYTWETSVLDIPARTTWVSTSGNTTIAIGEVIAS